MSLPENFICRPYRGVSVQHWDGPLDPASVEAVLLTREAYRRTEFIVLRGAGGDTALVRITCSGQEELFNPIVAVEWLGGPEDCAYLVAHDVDSANATALAEVALARAGGAPICVVEGRYQHVNFIVRPRLLDIRVVDVVPPEPPRLLDLVHQAIAIDDDLPPIRPVPALLDIPTLVAAAAPGLTGPPGPGPAATPGSAPPGPGPAATPGSAPPGPGPAATPGSAPPGPGPGSSPAGQPHYLLPCQGAGLDLPGRVDYLDQRPARADWVLVGCERSRQFHRWFYGDEPARQVELCPDRLTPVDPAAGPTLLRCCLLERGIRVEGNRAVVPWGTNLAEVGDALRALTGIHPVTPPAPSEH